MSMCSPDEQLDGHSPAALLVHRALEEIEPATREEIQQETLLKSSTARHALRSLQEDDLVETIGSADAQRPTYQTTHSGDNHE